jgi:hypothetical protein
MVIVIKKAQPGEARPPSLRAQKAVSLMVGNGGNKAKALIDAGYSPATANTPSKVFKRSTVKALVDPVVAKMEEHRDAILVQMKKKMPKANYASISMTLRNLNHDIQLLRGRATEYIDKPLDPDEAAKLDAMLSKNE